MKITRREFIRLTALAGASSALCPPRAAAVGDEGPPFRALFDGRTLAGWHAVPRLSVPHSIDPMKVPPDQLREKVLAFYAAGNASAKARLAHVGHWEVRDGAIVGGQQPPGSGLGAYFLTDETFGDFELELEARPDWPVDTGIMIRAHELGSIAFQVNLDHRPNGAIGGVFGNSIGSFRAAPFSIDGDELPGFRVGHLREGAGEPNFPCPKMRYAATFADFLQVWRVNDWNRMRVRCVGELPVITTWVNGRKICELDTASIDTKGYNPLFVKRVLGRTGHIGFEVHDNGAMGHDRWAPGAVCRWRDIRLRPV